MRRLRVQIANGTQMGVLKFPYEHNYEHNTDRATGIVNDTYEPLASTKEVPTAGALM